MEILDKLIYYKKNNKVFVTPSLELASSRTTDIHSLYIIENNIKIKIKLIDSDGNRQISN